MRFRVRLGDQFDAQRFEHLFKGRHGPILSRSGEHGSIVLGAIRRVVVLAGTAFAPQPPDDGDDHDGSEQEPGKDRGKHDNTDLWEGRSDEEGECSRAI